VIVEGSECIESIEAKLFQDDAADGHSERLSGCESVRAYPESSLWVHGDWRSRSGVSPQAQIQLGKTD